MTSKLQNTPAEDWSMFAEDQNVPAEYQNMLATHSENCQMNVFVKIKISNEVSLL